MRLRHGVEAKANSESLSGFFEFVTDLEYKEAASVLGHHYLDPPWQQSYPMDGANFP